MGELSDNEEAMIPPKSPVYVETDKCKIHLESLHHDCGYGKFWSSLPKPEWELSKDKLVAESY